MIVLLSGIAGMLSCNSAFTQDLESAIEFTKSERFDAADSIFRALIQAEPGNPKTYFYYGENTIQNYFADSISNSITVEVNRARGIYEMGVEADSTESLNYIGLAKMAFLLGEDGKAEQLRQKARGKLPAYKKVKKIKNPGDYAFALAKIAESYIREGKVDTSKALPYIREALSIDRTNPDIYLIAGDIYNLINDGSNAVKYYNLAQDYDPTSPTANMKIGSIYVRARSLMAAIPYYEQAISIDAAFAPAYRELGQLYSLAGRYDQSKEYFRKYLDLTAGNIPAKIRYVNALYYAKEYDEVISTVEEIFKVDKSRAYLNRIAAYSCYDKEDSDLDRALEYLDALFRDLPAENLIQRDYTTLAKILLKKNAGYENLTDPGSIARAEAEIDRAFEAYESALAMDPEDTKLMNEIANAYYTHKRYEGAAMTWEKMIRYGRDDVGDYLQVGRAYYMAEDYSKADSIFKIVGKKYPDNIQNYLMIARTYSRMDPDFKRNLARPKFETLIEKARADSVSNAPAMVEAFGYLGYYYLINKEYSRAEHYYDRMIHIDPDNKKFQADGYSGKANVWFMRSENAKEPDEKIPYFDRSIGYYDRVLELEPDNNQAKASRQQVMNFRRRTRENINPNELRGVIRTTSGEPINGASIRVKDTAAETVTNARGEFKFEIPMSSEALLISARGYQTKEIPITESRIYNEVLERE